MDELCQLLKLEREKKGYNGAQKHFAEVMGYSHTHYCAIENGTRAPSEKKMKALIMMAKAMPERVDNG